VLCALSELHIWIRTRLYADRFAEWANDETKAAIRVHNFVREALAEADIVCRVTAASVPIVERDAIQAECHLNAVGSFRPNVRELNSDTMAQCQLIVDSRVSALSEFGDVLVPLKENKMSEASIAQLRDVVMSQVGGRTQTDEVTVFKALGLAVEDLTAARTVYDRAIEQGVGSKIE
tara:strand:+ start:338 stop:868 length:531 start_codon:yes stop_codon:yes gene_type:complete